MVFFSICASYSQIFITQAGGVSFSDFWKLRYQYIGYSIFFILKTLNSLLGYQWVTNIPMYVNLRKFLTAMTFIYQYFFMEAVASGKGYLPCMSETKYLRNGMRKRMPRKPPISEAMKIWKKFTLMPISGLLA